MDEYTETTYQVWIRTPQGGFYVFRDDLIFPVARTWAKAWNDQNPEEWVGSTFHVIEATTQYKEV